MFKIFLMLVLLSLFYSCGSYKVENKSSLINKIINFQEDVKYENNCESSSNDFIRATKHFSDFTNIQVECKGIDMTEYKQVRINLKNLYVLLLFI